MFSEGKRTIMIENITVPINPDFRIMCEFSAAVPRKDSAALVNIAKRFYFAGIPEGVSENGIAEGIQRFYIEGLVPGYNRADSVSSDNISSDSGKKTQAQLFDFEEDEALFIAAFKSEYNIDLTSSDELHWFTFCAYFRGLSEDCRLKRIISIRNTSLSDIKSPEEKARIKKLKSIFSLKSGRPKKYASAAEHDADIKRQLEERVNSIKKEASE